MLKKAGNNFVGTLVEFPVVSAGRRNFYSRAKNVKTFRENP